MDLIKRVDKKCGIPILIISLAIILGMAIWAMTGEWIMIFSLVALIVFLVLSATLVTLIAKYPGTSLEIIILLVIIAAYIIIVVL